MRRRQLEAQRSQQSQDAESDKGTPILGHATTKGVCPKCGTYIGKGVGFHAMRCKG